MSRKSKGINAERNLIHKFWAVGWAAIRVAGSGSSKYPSPDLLVGNNLRKLAIECKSTKSSGVYLTKEEIYDLVKFAKIFGAEAWIAVKFDRTDWYFLTIDDLNESETRFGVNQTIIRNKGLSFEEILK